MEDRNSILASISKRLIDGVSLEVDMVEVKNCNIRSLLKDNDAGRQRDEELFVEVLCFPDITAPMTSWLDSNIVVVTKCGVRRLEIYAAWAADGMLSSITLSMSPSTSSRRRAEWRPWTLPMIFEMFFMQ
jgi:hypothetical protein